MNNISRQIVRIILTVALICLLVYVLWLIRSVIIYILISAVLSLIGMPMVDRLTGRSIRNIQANRTIASVITMVLFLSVTVLMMSMLIPSILEEIKVLSQLDIRSLFASLNESVLSFQQSFDLQSEYSLLKDGLLHESLADIFDINTFTTTVTGFISSLGNILFAVFSILFITFYFLKEKNLFRNVVLALVPTNLETNILNVAPRLKKVLSRYFLGLIIQIMIVSALISFGLYFIGFQNYIAIGVLAGLLNTIPYLGPLIGMSFGLILGLAANMAHAMPYNPISLAVFIIIVFGAVQIIDNFFLQPFIFSTSINAHPLEIFLVIAIAAILGGIPGMIVAVPTYSVLRLLAHEFFPNVKFIRVLTSNLAHIEREDSP